MVQTLLEEGALSQADISRRTGLSRTTISSLVAELKAIRLVIDTDTPRLGGAAHAGRPGLLLTIDDSAGAAVGVDFGHRHVRVAVANLAHVVLAERAHAVDVKGDPHELMTLAARIVVEVLAEAGVEHSRVLGVGVGLPGPIDRERGMVGSASILPAWADIPAAAEMSRLLGLPVELDNDSNLGALAEAVRGAGQGCSHVAYVKAATGICVGLVIDGQLYRGADGTAGELGHIVVAESGPMCYCGNRGCLETLVGGPAITELLRHAHGEQLDLDAILRKAADGDLACQRALADVGRQMGKAIAIYCNLVNPRRVVIGGTLSLAGELLLAPLRDSMRQHTLQLSTRTVDVVPAELGDRAEVLGALTMILRAADGELASRLQATVEVAGS
ncbi:MAG: ROK family transcriptional regulator [Mycobacteriales bacterium]